MNRQIYRGEALRRLASPEQLDSLMPLTDPRGWLVLASLGLVLAAALAWAGLGSIRQTVTAQGTLVRPGGVRFVTAPRAGTVERVTVTVRGRVEAGQEVCRLTPDDGKGEPSVLSPAAARVVDVSVQEGEHVEAGAALVTLESTEVAPVAVVYLSAPDGYRVSAGATAWVDPVGAEGTGVGSLSGTVTRAGRYPSAKAASLGGPSGPWFEVVVALKPEDPPARGEAGRHAGLYSGTPCRATVLVGELKPLRLIGAARVGSPAH